jgi:predicted porin
MHLANIGVFAECRQRLGSSPIIGQYRFMSVFSAVIDKTERYELNARYDFDGDGIANINLNYTDGENADTIQDERYWSVKFGLKF